MKMAEAADDGSLSCYWSVFGSLAVLALLALHFYYRTVFEYWKRRGFPEISSTPIPLFGHTFGLLVGQRNITDTFCDLYKALGDKPYGGFFQGPSPCLLVKDQELIKHILIKDFHVFMDRGFDIDGRVDPLSANGLLHLKGQRWKEMKARLSPSFTSGRIKSILPLMQACADEFLHCLKTKVEKNSGEVTLEIKENLACFSIDVIATCAFGIRCDALQNPETSEFRRMGKLTLETSFKRSVLMALLFISPKLLKMLGLKFTDDESSVFFRNFVKDMLEKREAAVKNDEGGAKGYGDFIHQLVLLKKRGLHPNDLKDDSDEEEVDNLRNKNSEDDNIKVDPSWRNVTLDDLTAQVMQFFSAGFETTSSLISFAIFELSSSEHGKVIQKKLREEIDKVIKADGGKITYEGLKKMHLLDRVLSETLRMYSPVGIISRKALQPYTIPGTNLNLEKGMRIFIPNQAMHRDEKIFPNAMRFEPDRFLPELKEQRSQFAYLPFGDGPRLCIGQTFALMHARLGLAVLVSNFEFEICAKKTRIPLRFDKRAFILKTESGIWTKIKLRK